MTPDVVGRARAMLAKQCMGADVPDEYIRDVEGHAWHTLVRDLLALVTQLTTARDAYRGALVRLGERQFETTQGGRPGLSFGDIDDSLRDADAAAAGRTDHA